MVHFLFFKKSLRVRHRFALLFSLQAVLFGSLTCAQQSPPVNAAEEDPSLTDLWNMARTWGQERLASGLNFFAGVRGQQSQRPAQGNNSSSAFHQQFGPAYDDNAQAGTLPRIIINNRAFRMRSAEQGDIFFEAEAENQQDHRAPAPAHDRNPHQAHPEELRPAIEIENEDEIENEIENRAANIQPHAHQAAQAPQQAAGRPQAQPFVQAGAQGVQAQQAHHNRVNQPARQPILVDQANHNLDNQNHNAHQLLQAIQAGDFQQALQLIQNNPTLVSATDVLNKTIFHHLATYYNHGRIQEQVTFLFQLLRQRQFTFAAHHITRIPTTNAGDLNCHFIHMLFFTCNQQICQALTEAQWNELLTIIEQEAHLVYGSSPLNLTHAKFTCIQGTSFPLLFYASRNNVPALLTTLFQRDQQLLTHLYNRSEFDINRRDEHNKSLLFYALYHRQYDLLGSIFNFTADDSYNNLQYNQLFNYQAGAFEYTNQSYLMLGIYTELPDNLFIRLLERSKSYLHHSDQQNYTALHLAIKLNRLSIVRMLLEAQETQNEHQRKPLINLSTNQIYQDILYFALYYRVQTNIIDLLLRHKAPLICTRLVTDRYIAGDNVPDALIRERYQNRPAQNIPHAFEFFVEHALEGNPEAYRTAICFHTRAQSSCIRPTTESVRRVITTLCGRIQNAQTNIQLRQRLADIKQQFELQLPRAQQIDQEINQAALEQQRLLDTMTNEQTRLRNEVNEERRKSSYLKKALQATAAGLTCYFFPETTTATALLAKDMVIATGSALFTAGSWLLSTIF